MSVYGRWIVLGIVIVAIAAVAYIKFNNHQTDTATLTAVEENRESGVHSDRPHSTAATDEVVEKSQLPRMLELGSVG